jgi:hypothetical protein
MNESQQGRREFIKKLAYATPAVLTLTAKPSLASSGSGFPKKPKRHDDAKEHRRNHFGGKEKGWH